MTDKQKVIEICIQYLNCKKEDIIIHKDRLQGRSNRLFLVEINAQLLTVRLPGEKSEVFIENRAQESKISSLLETHSLTSKTHVSFRNGVKISDYIEGDVLSDIDMEPHIKNVAHQLRKLHGISLDIEKYDPILEIDRLDALKKYREDKTSYLDLINKVKIEYSKMNHQYVLIHGDFNPDNIIVTKDKNIQFIDFEYATCFDPLYDIASFMSYSEKIMNKLFLNYVAREKREIAYKKVIYYRILQCLKWYNVALLKDEYNLGVDLVIDFKSVSDYMLTQASLLWIKYKETL